MKGLEHLGEVISTDVLVIGGGIAGLCAGIKARESATDVLIVDKGGVGWAGQVPISGGHIAVIPPEQITEFFQWTVKDGEYLNNQDWTYAFAQNIYRDIMELDSLNFPFFKNKGEVTIYRGQKYFNHVRFNRAKSLVRLKATATKRGVRTLDKIFMVDLLRKEGKVTGAIGFGLVDGKTYIFDAKAVVIASGSCRYKRTKLFVVNAGEGVAMAYRAGAQLRNAEFTNTYGFAFKSIDMYHRLPIYLWFENASGENIMEKYYPEAMSGKKAGQELQDFWQITDAMVKEVEEGKGPIFVDLSKLTPEEKRTALGGEASNLDDLKPERQQLRKDAFRILEEKAGIDPYKDKVEVHPMFVGAQGPLRIDLDCRTTVEGLWAAGDAPSLGSGWTGARASGTRPGGSIAFGIVSGFRAGESVGEYVAKTGRTKMDAEEVKSVKQKALAPLGGSNRINARDVMYQIHEAIVPVKYNFHREGGRLKEALGILARAKENLAEVGARDHHQLSQYHQAESMALSAELALKSALLREESRGTHHRDDFPDRDDRKWLKWVIAEKKDGVAQLTTEAVPLEKYRLKPQAWETQKKSTN